VPEREALGQALVCFIPLFDATVLLEPSRRQPSSAAPDRNPILPITFTYATIEGVARRSLRKASRQCCDAPEGEKGL
jgi:hypothetical protein